jgi:deoxyribonuclease V
MKIAFTHRFDLTYAEAVSLQAKLRTKVRVEPLPMRRIRFVAGADIAISKLLGLVVAAVVVFRFPELELVESRVAASPLTLPYIPGLLSFREIPGLVGCLRHVTTGFDVLLCDGQGIAHPRGIGLASHLGIVIRKPTIGCAKSRLVGEHAAVGGHRGDYVPLWFEKRRVGSVMRTQDGVRPLYLSPGHRVDHPGCRRIVLACAPKYRLPEPVRQADRLAGEEKRRLESRG